MALPRSRVLILAAAAAGVLLIGNYLRPTAERASAVPADVRLLETTGRRGILRDIGTRLQEPVAAVAEFLVYAAEHQSTAVPAGPDGGYVLSPRSGGPLAPFQHAAGGRTPHLYNGSPEPGDWLVAVARNPQSEIVWTAGIYGGRVPAECGGLSFREMHLSTPVAETFAGGAVMDAQSRLVGVLVRCGGRAALMPLDTVSRALATASGDEARWGYSAEPLDAGEQKYFGAVAGELVTEVAAGSAADAAGLRPGDVVIGAAAEGTITVQRNGRTFELKVPARDATMRGLAFDPRTRRVTAVEAGSAAARAGLAAGDLLVSAGREGVTPAAAVRNLLRREGPVYIVFERDGVRRGVLVP